jgi:chromosome segregation ATPase
VKDVGIMHQTTTAPGTVDLDDTAELPALPALLADGAPASLDDTSVVRGIAGPGASRTFDVDAEDRDDEDDDAFDDGGVPARFPVPGDAALADSVRDVERWIDSQRAQAAAVERELERLRESEAESVLRATTVAAELAGVRELLAAERTRATDLAAALGTHSGTIDVERARNAELAAVLRRTEDDLADLRRRFDTLQAALESREAALAAAQADAAAERDRAAAARAEAAEADRRVRAADAALASARDETASERERAARLHERLQTRDFRRGAYETVMRERDAELETALARLRRLESERDRSVADLHHDHERALADLAASRDAALAALRDEHARELGAAHADLAQLRDELARSRAELAAEREAAAAELARERDAAGAALRDATASLDSQIATLVAERATLASELAALHAAHVEVVEARRALEIRIAELRAHDAQQAARLAELETLGADALRSAALQADAARSGVERAAEAERVAAAAVRDAEAARTRCREMEATLADLESPRRALERELAAAVAERDELRALSTAQAEREQQLREALERTRGVLEERDLMLERLERKAATSAYALGRIKTTIERSAPAPDFVPRTEVRWIATLTRVDGEGGEYALGRTTRLGRAPDNDVVVQAVGISRHHAVLTTGLHGTHIEDLNSTNGVRVNGRRVQRERLNDGDHVSIGTAEFTFRRRERADA